MGAFTGVPEPALAAGAGAGAAAGLGLLAAGAGLAGAAGFGAAARAGGALHVPAEWQRPQSKFCFRPEPSFRFPESGHSRS